MITAELEETMPGVGVFTGCVVLRTLTPRLGPDLREPVCARETVLHVVGDVVEAACCAYVLGVVAVDELEALVELGLRR